MRKSFRIDRQRFVANVAIALRGNATDLASQLWAQLAAQHDGEDRWYLEALGIGADGQWNRFLDAYLSHVGGKWDTPAGRDIIWRSRASQTPQLLARIINDPQTSTADLPRYFRAFDFQKSPAKNGALVEVAFTRTNDPERQKLVTTEAFKRLQGFNAKDHMQALDRALDGMKGTSMFVALVDKYNVDKRFPELLAMAQANPDEQVGVEAIRVLLANDQRDMIAKSIAGKDLVKAAATARALGNSADGRATGLLLPIVKR